MRKIIRIITIVNKSEDDEPERIVALCDDGTVWINWLDERGDVPEEKWHKLPNIPQDEGK